MNQNFFAIMNGSKNGKFLISTFINDDKMPNIGDILVTSGNANIFPKDILVGKIIDITDTSIIALPFVDLKNLEFVQVINNQ
jgi:cell shape-determining protein MreC